MAKNYTLAVCTAEEITNIVYVKYPGRWKDLDSCRGSVNYAIRQLNIKDINGRKSYRQFPISERDRILDYLATTPYEVPIPKPALSKEPAPMRALSLEEEFSIDTFPRMSEEAFETPSFRDLMRWLLVCDKYLSSYVIKGDSYTSTAYIRACAGIEPEKNIRKLREKYGEQITFETILSNIIKED